MKRYLILSVTILTTVYYIYIVAPDCARNPAICYDIHESILNHTADAPYRYRVLSPLLVQALERDNSEAGVINAYVLFHALLFPLLYTGLYVWLRKWLNEDRALLGVFIFTAFLPLAFQIYLSSPWATLELVLLVWGLVCSHSLYLRSSRV